jgi:hypothetical protein
MLVYYWSLLYFIKPGTVILRFSYLYFLFIIPVLSYIVYSWKNIFLKDKSRFLGLYIFLAVVVITSVIRHDYWSVASTSLFVFSIVVILNSEQKIYLGFLNFLFVLSIFLSIITYQLGLKEFPWFPDFSSDQDLLTGIGWRISLFRSRPESAVFALFILAANYAYNRKWTKYLLILPAFYFVIFSGYRSTLILLVLFILLQVVVRIVQFKSRFLYSFGGIATLFLIFFLVLFQSNVFRTLKFDNQKFLTELLFKSETVYQNDDNFKMSLSRDALWKHHLSIFFDHPIIGIGSEKVQDSFKNKNISGSTTGSESQITRWMASYGIITICLIIFMIQFLNFSIVEGNVFSYYIILLILFLSLFYGSFLVPYNFIFILLFSSIKGLRITSEKDIQFLQNSKK